MKAKKGKKLNGAKIHNVAKGATKPLTITAWKIDFNRGLVTLSAWKAKDEKGRVLPEAQSETGRWWQPMKIKVTFMNSYDVKWITGLYESATGNMLIPEYNEIVKPNNPNGGYWGPDASRM